ncbi:hypothetical protein [Kitasatospora sp. MY 5-36]|uniref:hypothetical protein n=1 Tax=Kitasatospora sp. MY 5-36 TaxID=1678027 RepID=UPI0006712597|nr:hypothetical protein [Kitasatospora sp. MY 5-36]
MAGSSTPRTAALAAAATAVALLLGPVPAATADPGPPLPTPHLLPLPANAAPLSTAYSLNNAGDVLGECYLDIPGRFAPRALRWNTGNLGLTALEPLPGEIGTRPGAMNEAGTAVGVSFATLTDNHPVRWALDGTSTALELPAGARGGGANGINNTGVVIGDSYDAVFRPLPVKWRADGTRVALPLLDGDDTGATTAVNDAGFVIGWSERRLSGEPRKRAVVWSPSGTVTALPLPPGIDVAGVYRITDAGVIVGPGRREGSTELDRVVLWAADGTVRDIGEGRPNSITNTDTVVGAAFDAARSLHAAYWNPDGTRTLLDGPAGQQSTARTINSAGTAVGTATGSDWDHGTALLWKRDGTAVTLPPSSLSPYASASLVNESGVIVGHATLPDAQSLPRAMVWKP